jgi:hypothetical protein
VFKSTLKVVLKELDPGANPIKICNKFNNFSKLNHFISNFFVAFKMEQVDVLRKKINDHNQNTSISS